MISRDELILLYERLLAKYSFYENLLNTEYEIIVDERMDELEVLLRRKQQYLEFLSGIRTEIAEEEAKSDFVKDEKINLLKHEVEEKLKELYSLQHKNKEELTRRFGELSESISRHHLTRNRVAAYKSNK